MDVAQPASDRGVQFRRTAATATATTAASAAASTGDADVPGWVGDRGDGHMPGAAASATATGTGARARILAGEKGGPRAPPGGLFFCLSNRLGRAQSGMKCR